MKWRLQEGRGEAVYQIGVEDNGMLVGLSEEDMRASLKTLHLLAEKWVHLIKTSLFFTLCIIIYIVELFLCNRIGADITILRQREVDYDSDVPRNIAEVLIRKVPDDQQVGLTEDVFLKKNIFKFAKICFCLAVLRPTRSSAG